MSQSQKEKSAIEIFSKNFQVKFWKYADNKTDNPYNFVASILTEDMGIVSIDSDNKRQSIVSRNSLEHAANLTEFYLRKINPEHPGASYETDL